MADLRALVTGADGCTPGGAGPSNAAGSLADALLGRRGKQQQQLQELPGAHARPGPSAPYAPPTAAAAAEAALGAALPPGAAFTQHAGGAAAAAADVDAFLRGAPPRAHAPPDYADFESIYAGGGGGGGGGGGAFAPPLVAAAPAGAHHPLGPVLHAFLGGGAGGGLAAPVALPPGVRLSPHDAARIRDRATILGRQVHAGRGGGYADAEVARLLRALRVDPGALPAGGAAAGAGAWDSIWRRQQSEAAEHAAAAAAAAAAQQQPQQPVWVSEFEGLGVGPKAAPAAAAGADAWAGEFAAGAPAGASWAAEHAAAEEEAAARGRARGGDPAAAAAGLAATLAASVDPKVRNSQFAAFMSKMSRGEVVLRGNAAVEVPPRAAAWAAEFADEQRQRQREAGGAPAPAGGWAAEYAGGAGAGAGATGDWADEFAGSLAAAVPPGLGLGAPGADGWAAEYASAAAAGADADAWADAYAAELERLHSGAGPVRAGGGYRMAADNPFLTDLGSMAKARDLFRRGVLTEAALALEAEVTRRPENAEAWLLLGNVCAENDDDGQAIAALNQALLADEPGGAAGAEALLALGVSHTNELDAAEAAGHLAAWLRRHPSPAVAAAAAAAGAPPDSSQATSHAVRAFEAAAAAAPADADVLAALGVLYNLARRHADAAAAFRAALQIKPDDYSLWNKLGATLANGAAPADAVAAYQRALDLKPNYVRAWTNMGIARGALGDHAAAARLYARALAMNPGAAAVWGYLRAALAAAGAGGELLAAADAGDLAALTRLMPLE